MTAPLHYGRDEYYKPFQKYARDLTIDDKSTLMMKVIPANDNNYSHMGNIREIIDISYEKDVEYPCCVCDKPTKNICSMCKLYYFCSDSCFKEDSYLHKKDCYERKVSPIIKLVIKGKLNCSEKESTDTIITANYPYALQYLKGWANVKEMINKGILSLNKIDERYRKMLKISK